MAEEVIQSVLSAGGGAGTPLVQDSVFSSRHVGRGSCGVGGGHRCVAFNVFANDCGNYVDDSPFGAGLCHSGPLFNECDAMEVEVTLNCMGSPVQAGGRTWDLLAQTLGLGAFCGAGIP